MSSPLILMAAQPRLLRTPIQPSRLRPATMTSAPGGPEPRHWCLFIHALAGGRVPLPLSEVDSGTVLYRLARIPFADPAYVARAALLRVDTPDRSFGVCYL